MNKHKILREDILPAMASNRKVQRLLNEFMNLLSEYDTSEMGSEPTNPPSPPSQPTKDTTDSNPPTTDKTDSAPATATQENLVEPNAADDTLKATDEMEIVILPEPQADSGLTNQVQTVAETSDQMNIDPPAPDQVENAAPLAE